MSPPRRRSRGKRLRQGAAAAAWLLLFLGALGLVIWRQTRGVALERALHELQDERAIVEAERVQLERRILALSSRARVVRLARERLGLYLPADTQIVFLPLPVSSENGLTMSSRVRP